MPLKGKGVGLARARELLGEAGRRLSDEEIAQECRELEDLARLLVRRFDREHLDRSQTPQGERLSA